MSIEKETLIGRQMLRDYDELIKKLTDINGTIYHLNDVYRRYIKCIEAEKFPKNITFLASGFSFYSPITGILTNEGFTYEVTHKNIEKKVKLFERIINNQFSAQGYEAFEKFLRKITSRLIVKYKKRALEYNPRLGFSNVESCKLFLSTHYKENLDLLKLLRFLMPNLNKAFESKKELQNYFHFYKVYTKARHCIIHSDNLVTEKAMRGLDMKDKDFFKRYFRIQPGQKNIDTTGTSIPLLEGLGQMAYLIIISFEFKYPKQREYQIK